MISTDWTPFKSILVRVRLLLMVDWVPIGLYYLRYAISQYDKYAIEVARLLENGADGEAIREYLIFLQREVIEM